jgi:hypothetical protein
VLPLPGLAHHASPDRASHHPRRFWATIKPTSPLSTLRCQRLIHFVAVQILPSHHFRPQDSLSPPAAPPQPFTRCANHLFLDAPITTLGPPSILPRSTPLKWPLVPIRLSFRSSLPRRQPGPHNDVDEMPGHPRRRLPTRALALKSASVPPFSRLPRSIPHAAPAASSSNKPR